VRYACASFMSGLVACPFCRQMFAAGEAQTCPECGLGLSPLSKLPASHDAQMEEPDEPVPADMQPLPWTYAGRGRALLFGLAACGLIAFFMPWVRELAPEIGELSGFDIARKLPWTWASAVAWFVMIPLVISRRSISKMRGARVAVGFLAGIVLTVVCVRLGVAPSSSRFRPVRLEWTYGIWATGLLSITTLIAAGLFGGKLEAPATAQPHRRGDEVLH
jgi:hypothetical protein